MGTTFIRSSRRLITNINDTNKRFLISNSCVLNEIKILFFVELDAMKWRTVFKPMAQNYSDIFCEI